MQMIRTSAQTHITRTCGATSKRCLRLGDFDDFKFGNCVFLVIFSKNDRLCLVENRGRIVAYRDYGLSYKEIGSRVGRNQTTLIPICDCWIQKGKTDRCGRSHSPLFTTSTEDRQIMRMAMTDRSVTSRTIAQHFESVTHHSVFTCNIRRRLQQSGLSARCPLLDLPLTQNNRCLRREWCDESKIWAAEWNEVVFTDESCICLQHHNGRFRVWRYRGERMLNSCVMQRHTGPAPGIMVWGGIGYHSHTPLVRIAAATPDQLRQRVVAALSAVPQEHIQSIFDTMPRRVAAVISNNGGCSCY
ncbi:transposable element Tcb1 transposase [Trichonephila clavipes]|uniref:Transposable element Tcb1 transposase n=1 Tax=Trichonephila clavipes TaxID=2585209 RepID=A0A8X7B929_TRICX|nr:transposable element Tcb1 transposase [Trichonephila clavipes]